MHIRDFSKLIGVSTATVSRAFTGRGRISEKTQLEILEAARRHGYNPNVHAQRLSLSRSFIIGVFYSFSAEPIFDYYNMELATEIAKAASRAGYGTQLELTDATQNSHGHATGLLEGKGLDGIILVADTQKSATEFLARIPSVPCVVISSQLWKKWSTAGFVHIDIRPGIEQALSTLIRDGHRRIGFIRGGPEQTKTPAYLETMQKFGLPAKPEWIADGPKSYEDGGKALQPLLKAKVSAVLCATDILALGVMHATAEKGIRVPTKLSVVGIDDLAFAAYTSPSLSSIGISRQQVGQAAVEILDRYICEKQEESGTSVRHLHTVTTTFIQRKSSGKYMDF